MAGNNLLVNWLNKNTVLGKAASAVQTGIKNSGINMNDVKLPNLPSITGNNATTKTPQPIKFNTKYSSNVNDAVQKERQSNFIGFQNNNLSILPKQNNPQTDLAGNVIKDNLPKPKEKETLVIPTKQEQLATYNKQQEQKYRTNEQVIKDFHYDVQKNNGMMSKEMISQLYPEFQGKEDIAMMLQADILPLVQQNQFADMNQLSDVYPELLAKQKSADAKKLSEKEKIENNNIKFLGERAEKLLSRKNTLSQGGKEYMQNRVELSEYIKYVRDNYNLPGNPTDADILNYSMEQIPEVKALMNKIKNSNLTEMDKAAISRSSKFFLQNIIATGQEGLSDTANMYQEIVSQPLHNMIESGELARRLNNIGLNTSAADKVANISKIPVDMGGGILGGADKVATAYTRISQGQDKSLNEVTKDVINLGGGALDVGFNTALAIPTAIFHLANETEAGKVVTENTLGLFQEGIVNILDGTFTESVGWSKDNPLSQWYNSLDEETQSDLVNVATLAVLHKGNKVVKNGKIELGVLSDAITDAIKQGKNGAKFQAWIEKGMADENGKFSKGAASRIANEGYSAFKEALKTNMRMYDTVLKNRKGEITANMNTLPDNRTTKEKVQSQINQAKETVNEGVNAVKEGVNTVKEGVNNVIDTAKQGVNKGVDLAKQGVETVKNKVTSKKTTEVKPVEESAGWSQPKQGVVSKVVGGVAKVGGKVYDTVVEPVATKGAEIITSTTNAQDKLFKAVSPTLNKLTNKRGNYEQKRQNADRTNELIVEYGNVPENTTEYYNALIRTKQALWKNEIKRGLDEHKYTEVDAKEITNAVREAMSDDAKYPLETNKADIELLNRELAALDDIGQLSLERLEAIKQQINAKVNYGKNPTAGEVYEKGLRELNRKISEIEDQMISELPGEFTKFKKDYGALKDMEEDVLKMMLKDMKKKDGGGLIQNRGRIEGLGKLTSKPIEGILQFFLGESLGKAKDVNFNIKTGFEQLKNEYKGKKKTLNVKGKDEGETKSETPKEPTPKTPTENTPTEKVEKTAPKKKSESKPKNKVTSRKSAVTEKKTEVKEEKKAEQPKAEKQLETKVEAKQPEPKKDNTLSTKERLKANGFEDIDTKGINLDNIDVKKMSEILNKSRDYRLGKDENGEYRVGYGDGTPKEKVNGDEAQLLMNIRDKKAPEEIKAFTGDKALTGAKLGYNKPTRNVVAKKSAVTEYVNETPQNERGQLEEIEAEENLRSNETPQRDIVEETKSEPKTTTEITGEKNVVTSKATETEKPKNSVTNKPVDNSSITGRFRNLTLQDYKEMQKYQGVENQLINGNEQGYITDKIKAELLNQEKPLIPNAEIDELELYPVNYDDLKELVDKKKEIQDAERKLMKKNDDNLSQQIEDLRYGYDNEMLPNLGIYEVEDVDKAVSIIEKAMQDAHFQFFKDKEGIKPLVEKYGNYWEQGKSVDKKENTNIIGKNNSLTTKNSTNGGKDLGTAEGGLNQGVQGASGSRDLQRTDGLSGTERDNTGGISGDLHKKQLNDELASISESAGHAIGQQQRKLLTRGEARAINQSSKDILEKHNFSTNPKDYTAEEIETLRQYEGAGGLTNKGEDTKGVLDQFYTPQTAIDAVWHLVDKYKKGKDTYTVLEPTVGTGRFIRDRANEKYEGHEIDKVPGTIAQILHPEAKISVGDFEDQFMDFTGRRPQEYQGGKKDIVVGNPPYSQRITPQQKNGLEPKIKRSEEFFIKKGIDVLDDGGVLAMVVPSTFLSNPMTYAKEQIFDNATLVDAYRLPEGVFPYTQVGTDIVVFKKSKSLFKRENNLSDNKRFEQHPEKVLGEVKERINRFGKLEKYVDGGGHPLDKLNAIYEDKKTETKQEQAENYSPVETKEETPIKQKTTTEITGEKNKVTAKTVTKKKPTKKGVKIENQTLIKGDKTDIHDGVFGQGELDNKLLEYSKKTDINGYVEGPVGELVENDPKNLNYYKMHAVINDLYFAGDIYEKLEQLERDKTHISEAQYKKQKEGLQAVMPEPYTIENHPFLSPLDQNIMEFETNEIGNVYDSTAHDYVDKKLPIKDVFLERFRRNVSSSTVNKNLAREYINGEAMRSTSGGYGLSDEEKAAKARHEKSVVMEQVNEIFNDWLWNKLDKDVQQKLLDKFNRENRSYVVPRYENMPLAVRGISKTFSNGELEIRPGQIEGINFLLSKGAGIVAHGVGHGKTIEGVVATREAQLRGWNKRPLIVAPGPTLYAQWVRTIKELYPDWEIVNLGGLTKADIKRLKDELGDDPRNWVKDGQVAILSMQGFGDNIEFRPNTQRELEAKLHDVMETKDLNVRQSESLDKKITQMLAPGKGASSDKYTYSEKGDFLRTMYTSLLENGKEDFITDFVERTKEEYPDLKEDVIRADAEAMWNEKPVLLEDLGIDHITVDEMHNFKNVFTSAKMQEDEYGRKDVNRYGQIIKGTSSARGQKMYLATQYILDRNNNRNVFGLTATPFNNQPIEMYNMLSFVGRNELEKMGLTNINDFFSRFAEFREGLAPKASGTELEYKFIMKDFANARDLQRTITQFINYKGDSEDLIKPEKKLKVPVLKMSDLQKEVQSKLEYMALAKENQGDVLKATNGMISNLVSPFIVAGTRTPTGWKDFLDNSPKLKYFADVLKELRAEGKQDGMFIYMPVGQEFHELYAEALSEYAGVPREKIGIIDSKTSAKKDEIAEKFRNGDVNVLIGGKNTAEGIDLQNNGYITAITSVGWNPTERVQVDGRVWRQGNYNNEVLSVVPLIENSADVIFMGKADQKGSRINNALEQMLFGGEGDLSADEMMMSLMTEPEKKARTQINIQSQEIDKEIYGLNSQKDRLQELRRRINDAQKDPEEIQKQIDNEKQAGRSWRLPSLKDDLKTATRAKEWIEAYKENNGELPTIEDIDNQSLELEKQVDELRARQSELKNNDDVLNNLIEEIKQKQEEDAKGVKTYQDYIEDIKSDFKNAKRFGSKEELKEYLDNKRKNVLSNDKNKITSK